MSVARFPCEHCGGAKLVDGKLCPVCKGAGFTIPQEGANDAIRDWESRNLWAILAGFALVIWVWLGPVRRWAFKADK